MPHRLSTHPPATAPTPSTGRRLAAGWRRVRRVVLVRRRLLAAVLAGLAVLTAVRAASLPPVDTAAVVVATEDLPGGSRLGIGDVTTVQLPVDTVPEGATQDAGAVAGRTLAAPVRGGEPLTDVRLVAPGILDGYPGLVAAPVRVADPAAVRLLSVGDRVDLVAVSPEGGSATVVADDVAVVAVPSAGADDGLVGGALVMVAVSEAQALALAEVAVRSVVSVVLTR